MCRARKVVPPELWELHGELYDLAAFTKQHPGGEAALALGRGDDATKLFESYHVMNENHRLVLAKYRVSRADRAADGRNGSFSAFHSDMKAMVRDHFAGLGADAHHAKYSHAALMAGVWAFYVAAWGGWYRGAWWALVALPFAAWLVMANMAHDGSHFAVSRRPWVNQLCLYAAAPFYYVDATWYVQHVASHHLATNDVDHDVDLHHHGACRWHPRTKSTHNLSGSLNLAWHATAMVASTLIMALVQPITKFLVPGLAFLRHEGLPRLWGASPQYDVSMDKRLKSGFATVGRLAANMALWATAAAVPVVAAARHGATLKGLAFGLLPYVFSSVFFMVVTQVSHVQRETQRRDAVEDPDFFKAQAKTALDYSPASPFWGFLTGGLNLQSIHHVLPCVHSSHYADLYPKFIAVCEKHDALPARADNLFHAFVKHVTYIYKLGELGSNDC